MGRSRYKIYHPKDIHFVTCTVLNWLPLFTQKATTDIIFESIRYLQKAENLKIYAYVILENHLHFVTSSDDIEQSMKRFKSITAKQLLQYLQENNVKTILDQLAFYKKAHKNRSQYQVWQEGIHPQLIQDQATLHQKIQYIHQNPVKRGYVNEAEHWRYSSARDYANEKGLVDIVRFW